MNQRVAHKANGKYLKLARRQLVALMWHCLLKCWNADMLKYSNVRRSRLIPWGLGNEWNCAEALAGTVYWLHCTTLLKIFLCIFLHFLLVLFILFLFFWVFVISSGRGQTKYEIPYMRTERSELSVVQEIHSSGNNLFALHCLNFTNLLRYAFITRIRFDSFAKITLPPLISARQMCVSGEH